MASDLDEPRLTMGRDVDSFLDRVIRALPHQQVRNFLWIVQHLGYGPRWQQRDLLAVDSAPEKASTVPRSRVRTCLHHLIPVTFKITRLLSTTAFLKTPPIQRHSSCPAPQGSGFRSQVVPCLSRVR